ncbi:MAG TPA: hypothetical protein VJC39_01445 [Candidatus Nanoarchaeia archaeon]|nr:hypothetical protein [Candidatus Nanoarchaeia archaeon]
MTERLYHGTTLEYLHQQLTEHNCYRHQGKSPVYFYDTLKQAEEIAALRADQWNGTPVIIALDKNRLEHLRTEERNIWPCCDKVEARTFEVLMDIRESIEDEIE